MIIVLGTINARKTQTRASRTIGAKGIKFLQEVVGFR